MVYTNNLGVVVKDKSRLAMFLVAISFAIVATIGMILPARADSTVVVTPSNTQGWQEGDMREGGEVNYVNDSTSPYPDGALQLKTDGDTASKAQYLRQENISINDVDELSYHTKQVSGPAVADPSFQVIVDLNGGDIEDGGFATLVYEPYWNGTITQGVWEQWDVNASDANLWSTRNFTDGTCITVNGAGGPPFYSLDDIRAICPDAVVLGIGVNVGTFNVNYDVYADGITLNDTTYNFELTNEPTNKNDCKQGGWEDFGFRNQGQCIRFVNTGQDSR